MSRSSALAAALLVAAPVTAQVAQDSTASADQVIDTGPTAQDNDSSSAYIRAPEPPLPELPTPPALRTEGYPACREDFEQGATVLDRAQRINACTGEIDRFYNEVMLPYRQAMIVYQGDLSALYTAKVVPEPGFLPATKDGFYARMMEQHRQANPDGTLMADYRAAEVRYKEDRAYLQDRYCFTTGCGGYPAPDLATKPEKPKRAASPAPAAAEAAVTAAPAAAAPAARSARNRDDSRRAEASSDPKDKCGKARKRGSALGGLLGGVAGGLGGLGRNAAALASGLSGLVVGELACKLTDDEQVKAAEATVAVTRTETVGAKAEWTSPTRAGVAGSSTVTALNTEPNGRRCLNITDVAIIDGEETRVAKRMCRGRGESGYTMVA